MTTTNIDKNELIEKASCLVLNEITKGNKRLYWFNVENPTLLEIQTLIERIKSHSDYDSHYKIHLLFSEPVSIQQNKRSRKVMQEANLKFFTANGRLCYTFHSRSGYYVHDFNYSKLIRIGFDHILNEMEEKKKQLKKILNRRFDGITWSNLKADNCTQYPATAMSIKGRFPHWVERDIKNAFEQKKDYSYHMEGTKRHWSVETKMCDDGVFRAWFSSEYEGCGNGGYYLLLNPTTAAFCEYD